MEIVPDFRACCKHDNMPSYNDLGHDYPSNYPHKHTMSHKTDTAGKRTNQPTKTGWELFEMTPDGKLLRDQSTINVDVSALFPPLPADSAAAAGG